MEEIKTRSLSKIEGLFLNTNIMFGRLFEIIDNAKKLEVDSVAIEIWKQGEVRKFIVKLNAFEQLYKKGENKKGKVLGVYTEFTEIANELKPYSFEGDSHTKVAGEHYDFYDTGEFLNSFRVNIYKDGFAIGAIDEKEDGTQLTRKFGQDILGLSNDSINELAKEIIPLLQAEVRKKILK